MAVKILNGVDVVGNMNITASDVPNLDANKITSGTIGSARIPNLAASKITSGTLGTARIPNLDAGKITSGTFHSDRMPDLSSTYAAASHNHDDRYLRLGGGVIVHSSGTHGLEIYTNSAIPTTEQFKVGRDNAQYYGIRVDDGTARLIHRQDEAGSGTHNIISEIWTSTSGGGTWTWRLRDNAGSFREDYMTLNDTELDVNAHGRFGAHLTLGTTIDQGFYMDASNGAYRANGTTGTRGFYFQGYNGSGTTMYVGLTGNYAGKVGIGTTQPSAKLQVNGAIAINDAYTKIQEGTSNSVRISTNYGYGDIGPQNSSWFHFTTDRAAFYFGKRAEIAGELVPYQANQHNLGTSSKPWIRIYGTTIYQGSDRVLATRGDVHSELYSTGGNADTYTQFGIYRNYGEGQPTGLGHNTLLNVMQQDGNYGWQITSSTADGGDSMWYRQKGTTFGDGTWHQIASRSWVTSQGYGDATQAWVQAQGYITSETDSQTLSWSGGNGQLTISNGNTVDLDGRYMYGAVGNGGDFNDLTGGKNSNFVAFNASNITDAPDTSWYNGLVTTHSNYLSSYIVNKHRTNDWYLSWRDANITPSANWSRIWHDRDFSSTDVTNWNTAYGWGDHSTAGYMTPIYNGANDNSGKADFAVGVGSGDPALSFLNNQVQIGGTDINYEFRLDSSGNDARIKSWERDIIVSNDGSTSSTTAKNIRFFTKPSGAATTERVRIDGAGYTYFHGLDLAISNVNSSHGAGNYFRGSNTHLVIGTGGTLHLNMSGSTTVMHGTNWYSGAGDRQTNLGQLNTRFERVHTKFVGSQDAGLFFEDTDNYRCIRPAHMGTGDADGTTSLGYSNYRWATIYGNNLDVTSNVKVQGSIYTDTANYSIDLRDHGNHTWLRNETGQWSFQTGTSGDDWTQTYTLRLPAAGSSENNVWAELGQRTSNNTGRYKGLRIVKYENNSVVNGDLLAGHITVSSNTNIAGAQIKFNDHVPDSTQNVFLTAYHADGFSHGGGASLHLTSTEPNVTMVSERYHSIQHGDSSQWAAAYSWGNHANAGYLTGSHTHSAADITSGTLNGARLPWNSGNDGFTGTYPLVWRAGDLPWTASWLTVNGQLDQLNSKRFGSFGGDTAVLFQSYNASASNAEQFKIRHNYGNVDISNPRGNIYFETRADFETVVVAQTDLYVGNSIQHWGDGGTGMYFPSNDVVDLRTAGTQRLFVNSSGNVGIATTTPTQKLDVNGNIHCSGRIRANSYFEANNTQTRDKIRVWPDSQYAIGMKSGYTFGSLNDYAMSFQMNNDNDRGFWWGDGGHTDAQGAMALSTNGKLTVATSVRIGYGESDTSTSHNGALDVNGNIHAQGNVIPLTDRAHTLGLDNRRWQIVFCETLDSAGQHESNLQDREEPISQYATGTVLSWKDGKNRPCTQFADHMRMGIAVHGQDSPLIQGAEPVLCTGIVEEGDYLVTSDKEGHAVAVPRNIVKEQMLFDCVIGKALENGDGESHLIKTWINI